MLCGVSGLWGGCPVCGGGMSVCGSACNTVICNILNSVYVCAMNLPVSQASSQSDFSVSVSSNAFCSAAACNELDSITVAFPSAAEVQGRGPSTSLDSFLYLSLLLRLVISSTALLLHFQQLQRCRAMGPRHLSTAFSSSLSLRLIICSTVIHFRKQQAGPKS